MVVRIIAVLAIGITSVGQLSSTAHAAIEFSEDDAAGDPAENGVVSQAGVPANAGAATGGAAMASTMSDSADGTNGVGTVDTGFGGGLANGAAGAGGGGGGGGGSQGNDDAPDDGPTTESDSGSVPEPTTLLIWSVLAACAMGLYRIRRRR